MYGMIHRALLNMIEEQHPDPAVRAAFHQDPALFISASTYDDAVTFGLVQKAAAAFDLDLPQFLPRFGLHWIRFAAEGPYRPIIDFMGDSLPDFIGSLNTMHQGVRESMPGAAMPTFDVIESRDGYLCVRYSSCRSGLRPFVEGLFLGLFDRFRLAGDIRVRSLEGNDLEFALTFAPIVNP